MIEVAQKKNCFDKFSTDTTELIELYFYRPLGYQCAKLCAKIGISPNQVSIFDIILSVVAGIFLAIGDFRSLVIAGILMHTYILLDCTDGQLARMLSKCSAKGAVLDLAGNILGTIILAVSLGINLFRHHSFSYAAFLWCATFLSMAVQTSLHYFYAEELTYFMDTGKRNRFKNNSFVPSGRFKSFYFLMNSIFKVYIYLLLALIRMTNRRRYNQITNEEKIEMVKEMQLAYLTKSRKTVRLWSFMGTATMNFIFCTFCFLGRIDLFMWFIITICNFYIAFMLYKQHKLDFQYTSTGKESPSM